MDFQSTQSYWLTNSGLGIRRIVLFYGVLTGISGATAYINISYLYIPVTVLSVFTIIWVRDLILFGYTHRLAKVGQKKNTIEVIDKCFVGHRSDKSVRRLVHSVDDFIYSQIYLFDRQRINQSAYLDIIRRLFRQFYGKNKDTLGLFLGGGGFALPLYLASEHTSSLFEVVELDGRIVRLAKDYFFPLFPKVGANKLKIIQKDAYVYVTQLLKSNHKRKYNFIFQDICLGNIVPKKFLRIQWISKVVALLKQRGTLLLNIGTTLPPQQITDLQIKCNLLFPGYVVTSFCFQGTSIMMIQDRRKTV